MPLRTVAEFSWKCPRSRAAPAGDRLGHPVVVDRHDVDGFGRRLEIRGITGPADRARAAKSSASTGAPRAGVNAG